MQVAHEEYQQKNMIMIHWFRSQPYSKA